MLGRVRMLDSLTDEQRGRFEKLGEMLIKANRRMNLTRISGAEEIRVRHFEDSLVILGRLDEIAGGGRCRLADIGSGAGFPGLAIAIARPGWEVVSIEATGKKCEFQRAAVRELGLGNVEVIKGRAEELGRDERMREKFDAVTSRAVGSLAVNAELGVPLLKVGGRFFAWKGPKVEREWEKGRRMLERLGAGEAEMWGYELPGLEGDFRIVEAVKVRETPRGYPREFKAIKSGDQ